MSKSIIITDEFVPVKGQKLYVACSGGLDSMVLSSLYLERGIRPEILHVNYQLRGVDSDKDQDLVEQFCQKNGLRFHLHKINLGERLKTAGGNLQDIARQVRYDFFRKTMEPNSLCALAHHADDQIETFFMRLFRKSGLVGLSGIQPKRDNFIRPLLPFTKADLHTYAKSNKINWREDVSNKKNNYLRNRLRNEWIPLMEKKHPTLKESVLFLQAKFDESRLILLEKIKPISLDMKAKSSVLEETYADLNEHEKYLLANELAWPSSIIQRLNELTKLERSKFFDWPELNLRFVKEEGALSWSSLLTESPLIPELKIKETANLPLEFSKQAIYLSPQKLVGQLKIRKWQEGDRIASMGMTGSQLISDILKDAKVPISMKSQVLVVHDNQHIHWCVNYKIGRLAIAQANDKKIFKISLK
jgi:tRNA(Ile)-lysidine synthase